MISFENTAVAFANKSDKDLKRAYKLFKLVGNATLVKLGKWATNIALKLRLPIKGIVKKTIFKQFCGGETIDECDKTIGELANYGIGTILDYSVEGKTSSEDFEATCQEIIATLEKGRGDDRIPFAVFKVTGISRFGLLEKANDPNADLTIEENKEFGEVVNRVNSICKKAHECNTPVFIDAEESWIQDAIDRIAVSMMTRYNKERAIVFNTVQMYRHDRLVYLNNCIPEAKQGGYKYGVKLVRGAYMEKERNRATEKGYPSPIQPDKASSDRDYDLGLNLIVENIEVMALCAGTHNEESSLYLTEVLKKNSISEQDDRVYFAQLLGMSDHISFNLSNANYNVAKYVPYGPVSEVMPYLLRRADENTSVAGQTGRELSLITKEITRRKAIKK